MCVWSFSPNQDSDDEINNKIYSYINILSHIADDVDTLTCALKLQPNREIEKQGDIGYEGIREISYLLFLPPSWDSCRVYLLEFYDEQDDVVLEKFGFNGRKVNYESSRRPKL